MKDYKTNILKNNPDYANKYLLLANKNRDGLFNTANEEIVQVKIDSEGLLKCNFIKNGTKQPHDFLEQNDPPVEKVLQYLITPEMEIERIFNNIRFKYLQSILFSNIKNPSERISSDFNKAFQSFAGIIIYQGNTQNRVDNESYWLNAGFTKEARRKISFDKEFKELDFIVNYLRDLKIMNYNRIYAEIIAIKPGFHEIFIHDNYFDTNEPYRRNPETLDTVRDKVFKLLRGYGNLQDIYLDKLNPSEINRKKYFSYAPCNITEGPFVFRKKQNVSYFDEIRNIKQKESLVKLEENFHIYDYCKVKPKTIKELENILQNTEQFKKYLNV